jgi:putative protease
MQPVPHLALSAINGLRRGVVEVLRAERARQRPQAKRDHVPNEVPSYEKELSFLGNVLNQKAAAFWRRHGVGHIEPAAETGLDMRGRRVMLTRMCIKYELGLCPRKNPSQAFEEPWFILDDSGHRFRLTFRCDQRDCLMEIVYEG